MDAFRKIILNIESNISLYAQIGVSNLADGNAIAMNPAPSQPGARYLEGSKEHNFAFQIRCKHQTGFTAYQTMAEIEKYLESSPQIALDNHIIRKIECTTNTNFVNQTESGEQIYTALFLALLDEKE